MQLAPLLITMQLLPDDAGTASGLSFGFKPAKNNRKNMMALRPPNTIRVILGIIQIIKPVATLLALPPHNALSERGRQSDLLRLCADEGAASMSVVGISTDNKKITAARRVRSPVPNRPRCKCYDPDADAIKEQMENY